MARRAVEGARRGEGGHTLVELLLAIIVSTIIVGAVSAALILAVRTTDVAAESFAESYDAELLVNYFLPDAQSANIIGSSDTDTPCDALERTTDLVRLLSPRFAAGYRLSGNTLTRWAAPIEDLNSDGVPECAGSGRTQVLSEQVENVTAFSDNEHQVALTIEAVSGQSFTVSATQRAGTVDLNNRPVISSFSVFCHHLDCVGTLAATDGDGNIVSQIWDWDDGSPLSGSGQHEYLPPGGTYTVTVTVTDDAGATATASQDVTVVPNVVPVAVDDAYTTNEDVPIDIAAPGVLGNDTDDTGLIASLVTPPAHGTLTLNPDGSFLYTPETDFDGIDSFTYAAGDVDGASDEATVTLTVNPVNDAPLAQPDAYPVSEDTPLTVPAPGVLGNDSDIDSPTITAVRVANPTHGSVTLNANGSFTYTPAANYNGPDSFTYLATDGVLNSSTVTVSLNVASVNDAPPVANPDSYSTPEDTPRTVAAPGVLANDTDVDGDPRTAVLVTSPTPAQGSVTLNANGSFVLTPASNFNGVATFTYLANDGMADGNTTTVSVTVTPVNDIPVAVPESYTLYEDTVLDEPSLGVLGNDIDVDGDPLTAALVASPSHGAVLLNNAGPGSFRYTPVANYNGPDSFTYRANDGTANSTTVTVTLTVVSDNDPPVADGDGPYTTAEDTTLNVSAAAGVLTGDADPDGDPITAQLVSGPSSGNLTLNPNGSFTYVPTANFNGSVSFQYRASDGSDTSNTVTVTINVTAVNDAPTAVNDVYSTPEDTPLTIAAPGLLANDSDPEGAALQALEVSDPPNGSVTVNTNGSFTFTPNPGFSGVVAFTYQAREGGPGGALSLVATVTITVDSVNDVPVADGDGPYSTQEDVALSVTAANGVLTGDTDADGDPLTAVLVTAPSKGTFTLNPNGSFAFTPVANESGSPYVTFVYRASDGTALSAPITVTINVTAINDAPVGVPDSYTTNEDTDLVITLAAQRVVANDTDVENNLPLTAVGFTTNTPNGALTSTSANGSFTYRPDPNFNGTDTFTYQPRDSVGLNGLATTVTITVVAVNDAPAAVNDGLYVTQKGVPLTITAPGIIANDTDVDGNPLTAVLVSAPTAGQGSLVLNANGSFTFTPVASFTGNATFTYRANDGTVNSGNIATVTIKVNNPPTASFTVTYCTTSSDPCDDPNWNIDVNASASDTDGTIAAYSWNWGDSTSDGSGDPTTHAYVVHGARTITLTVTDSDGGTVTSSQSITPSVLTIVTGGSGSSRTATLTWSGVPGSLVDVYRNGSVIQNATANDGNFVRGPLSASNIDGEYWVCEDGSGTRRCTNPVQIDV